MAENRPNNKHHKMYWQFSKPPDQLSDEYSRDYPRATSVEGDDRRYEGYEASSSVPAAPSSDVRERLGTAPPPRR